MEAVDGANMPGLLEAGEGVDYVETVIADLVSLELELRALLRMEWRSEAAEECAEYLHACIRRVGQTAGDYETAAQVLADYENELRLEAGGRP